MEVRVHFQLIGIELPSIATQQQQIGHTQEGKVNQSVLGLLLRESSRDDVWYSLDTISALDSSSNSYRPGTLAYMDLSVNTLFIFFVFVFAVVRGDIDESGAEFLQSVYCIEN